MIYGTVIQSLLQEWFENHLSIIKQGLLCDTDQLTTDYPIKSVYKSLETPKK